MGKINIKAQKGLTPQSLRALQKKLHYVLSLTPQSKICDFLELFFRCEVTAKKLITSWHYATQSKPKKAEGYSVDQVHSAANYFSLSISADEIREIFISYKKAKGQKSKTCRQLRNSYVHSLSNTDKTDIENRFDELKANMDKCG